MWIEARGDISEPASRRGLLWQGLLVGCLGLIGSYALAGCSETATDDRPWITQSFNEIADAAIADAQAAGASTSQLLLLSEARRNGEMTYEQTRVAASAAVECINSAGARAEVVDIKRSSGLIVPGYDVTIGNLSEAETARAVDLCSPREYRYVTLLYQAQPKSRDMLGKYVESQEPVLRRCLESNGWVTDAGSSGWELAHQAVQVMVDTDGGVDCLRAADIDGL